jgi:carboxylesterase
MNLRAIQARIRADQGLIPGNRAFLLRPKGRPKARVLLLHGFSASPWEVRECGLRLQRKGFLVYGPRVAGHGQDRQAFDSHGFAQWMAGVETDFEQLAQGGGKLILVGHSGGGVLATLLAAKHESRVSGLALAAPAFRLADPTAPLSLIPLVRFFKPSLHFRAVHPDSQHWTLDYSTRSIAELVRAGRLGSEAAQGLRLPLLMLQAKRDTLVSSAFNEALFPKIPSPQKKLAVYDTDEHNVFHHYNPFQAQVFGWLEAFLSTL